MIHALAAKPEKVSLVRCLEGLMRIIRPLPLNLNLASVQNCYYSLLQQVFPGMQQRATQGDEDALAWTQYFLGLGDHLNFILPACPQELKAAA